MSCLFQGHWTSESEPHLPDSRACTHSCSVARVDCGRPASVRGSWVGTQALRTQAHPWGAQTCGSVSTEEAMSRVLQGGSCRGLQIRHTVGQQVPWGCFYSPVYRWRPGGPSAPTWQVL